MNRGFVFKTTGASHINEAAFSASRIKDIMPNVGVSLITDQDVEVDVFDTVIHCDSLQKNYSNKILRPEQIPYQKNVFLDTDTYVYEPVPELFEVLDQYDVSATICNSRTKIPDMPDAFREYNSGVYAFRKSQQTKSFFQLWEEKYWDWNGSRNIEEDQPSFTYSMHNSDVEFCPLPREYNCFAHSIGYLGTNAKILHGRPQKTLEDAGAYINKYPKNSKRIFYSYPKMLGGKGVKMFCIPASDKDQGSLSRLGSAIKQNGIMYTVRNAYHEFVRT